MMMFVVVEEEEEEELEKSAKKKPPPSAKFLAWTILTLNICNNLGLKSVMNQRKTV